MKKRLIPQKTIKNAYTRDLGKMDLEERSISKKEEVRLPREMMEILGEFISFIEDTNKIEGDLNNEN